MLLTGDASGGLVVYHSASLSWRRLHGPEVLANGFIGGRTLCEPVAVEGCSKAAKLGSSWVPAPAALKVIIQGLRWWHMVQIGQSHALGSKCSDAEGT